MSEAMKVGLFAVIAAPLVALAVACTSSTDDPTGGDPGPEPGQPSADGGGSGSEGGTRRDPIDANYKFIQFFQERATGEDVAKRVNDFIAVLNTEGAAGYRYLDGAGTGGNILVFGEDVLFVKDSTSTYSYKALPFHFNFVEPSTFDAHGALLAQMKAEGAAGYVFVKILPVGLKDNDGSLIEFSTLYRKDNGSNATFDYESAPLPTTAAQYEALCNAQGANGFRHWAAPYMANQGNKLYFMKDPSSSAKYSVRALTHPLSQVGSDDEDVKAQLREQGAAGYRLQFNRSFEDDKDFYNVYVKDTTQSSVFEYEFLTGPGTIFVSKELTDQANEQTRNGLRFLRDPGGPVYFSSRQCTGPLCVSPTETELQFEN